MSTIRHIYGRALPVLFLLTNALVVGRHLVLGKGYPAGWDVFSVIYPVEFLSKTGGALHFWEESSLGYTTPITAYHLLSGLAQLTGHQDVVIRLFVFAIVLFLPLNSYSFFLKLTQRPLAAAVAGLVFSTNQWVVSNLVSGHYLQVVAYGLLPNLFRLTWASVAEGNRGSKLLLPILLALFSLLRLEPLAYALVFLVLLALVLLIWPPESGRHWVAANARGVFLVCLLALPVLTAYAWLPSMTAGSIHLSFRFSAAYVRTTGTDLLHTFLGQGLIYSYMFWIGKTAWDIHQFLPRWAYYLVLSIVPVFSIVFGISRLLRGTLYLFLVLVILFSVAIGTGVNPPFGAVYEFLIDHIPLWNRLSEPNRWLMLTWFSYSSLVALLFTANRLRQKRYQAALAISMVVAIIFSSSFVYSHGLLTWTPPEDEVAPHKWVRQQSGMDVVMAFPFGYAYGFDRGGWLQGDIATLAAAFSGHPGLSLLTSVPLDDPLVDFNSYVAGLIAQKRTRHLPRLLGPYNVRFFTAQAYPPTAPDHQLYNYELRLTNWHQQFLSSQDGLTLVFEGPKSNYRLLYGESWDTAMTFQGKYPQLNSYAVTGTAKAYESRYWAPVVFSPPGRIVIVGGYETYARMTQTQSFDPRQWAIKFYSDMLLELPKSRLLEEIAQADLVVLGDAEMQDLVLPLADAIEVPVKRFLGRGWVSGQDGTYEGTLSAESDYRGEFVLSRRQLVTRTPGALVEAEVDLGEKRVDELWLRVATGVDQRTVEVMWDGGKIGQFDTHRSLARRYEWFSLSLPVAHGSQHRIGLICHNDASGECRADRVLLVNAADRQDTFERITAQFSKRRLPTVAIGGPSSFARLFLRGELDGRRLDEWENLNGPAVEFKRSKESPGGETEEIALVSLRGPRQFAPLVSLRPKASLDLSAIDLLVFWFRGVGDGRIFNVYLFSTSSDGTRSAWRVHSFFDVSAEWRRVVIPVEASSIGRGDFDKSAVHSIDIDTPQLDVSGKQYAFSRLTPVNLKRTETLRKRVAASFKGIGVDHLLVPEDLAGVVATPAYLEPPPSRAQIVSITRESPSRYRVLIRASGPYQLVFARSFSALWRARSSGRDIEPSRVFGVLNGYSLEGRGSAEVILQYEGQQWQYLGFGVSLTSLLVLLLFSLRQNRQQMPRIRLPFTMRH